MKVYSHWLKVEAIAQLGCSRSDRPDIRLPIIALAEPWLFEKAGVLISHAITNVGTAWGDRSTKHRIGDRLYPPIPSTCNSH